VSTMALQLFFALLAVFVNAATVLLATTLLFRRTGWGSVVLTTFAPFALPLAFLVSLTATAGSLWFSEAVGFVPCKLCWYQRIAVFPLPLVLGAMMLRRDVRAARYVLPVVLVGALVSIWHWLVERVPALSGSTSCAVDVPCSVPWFTEFGFVTLAWMALSTLTFVAVAILAGNAGAASTGTGEPAS
jgi:disulfide bond formation protein DsbB